MEEPDTIEEFIDKAQAALVAVGIVRDSFIGNFKRIYVYLYLNESCVRILNRFITFTVMSNICQVFLFYISFSFSCIKNWMKVR